MRIIIGSGDSQVTVTWCSLLTGNGALIDRSFVLSIYSYHGYMIKIYLQMIFRHCFLLNKSDCIILTNWVFLPSFCSNQKQRYGKMVILRKQFWKFSFVGKTWLKVFFKIFLSTFIQKIAKSSKSFFGWKKCQKNKSNFKKRNL